MASSDVRLDTEARKRLLEEHRRVNGLTQGLRKTRDLELLLAHVTELQGRLPEHFAREEEESTGFFASVCESAPRHVHRVKELTAEHRQLLVDLEALAVRLRDCLQGPVAEALSAAARFGRHLRRHEIDEHDLMMEVFNTDLGQGD